MTSSRWWRCAARCRSARCAAAAPAAGRRFSATATAEGWGTGRGPTTDGAAGGGAWLRGCHGLGWRRRGRWPSDGLTFPLPKKSSALFFCRKNDVSGSFLNLFEGSRPSKEKGGNRMKTWQPSSVKTPRGSFDYSAAGGRVDREPQAQPFSGSSEVRGASEGAHRAPPGYSKRAIAWI